MWRISMVPNTFPVSIFQTFPEIMCEKYIDFPETKPEKYIIFPETKNRRGYNW